MSVKVISYVWDHADHKGAELLMLLALADACSPEGECWPGVGTLAHKARVSVRYAQTILKRLEKAGSIKIAAGEGCKTVSGWTNRYTVLMNGVNNGSPLEGEKEVARGEQEITPLNEVSDNGVINGSPDGVIPRSPKPSGEPSVKEKDSSTADAAELDDHDEPDGTSPSMIENLYKVKPGEDWLQPILEKWQWDGLVAELQEWPEYQDAPDDDGLLVRMVNFCMGKLKNPRQKEWAEFQPKVCTIQPVEVRWLPVWYEQTYPDQEWISQPATFAKYFRLLRGAIKNGWRPGQSPATNGAPNAEAYQETEPASGNMTALDVESQARLVKEYLKRSA